MALFKKSKTQTEIENKKRLEALKNLEELRASYKKAITKYGPRYFPLLDLEKRITHVFQTKGNLSIFFQQEVDFFMSLVKKVEQEEQEKERKRKINEKFEEIMKSNNEKIKKYPEAVFSYPVPFEIKHFCGGITFFMDDYEILIESLFRGTPEWKKISTVLSELERFIVRPQPSIFLNHYLQNIQSKTEDEIDTIERKILQTGGLNIHKLMKYIEFEKNELNKRNSHYEITFSEYKNPDLYAQWNKVSSDKIMNHLIENLKNILSDFRLNDLVNHALMNESNIVD